MQKDKDIPFLYNLFANKYRERMFLSLKQIIPYLISLSQYLDSISLPMEWISSANGKLLEFLQIQGDGQTGETASAEALLLENSLLRALLVRMVQLLIGQCLFFPKKKDRESSPEFQPYKGIAVDAPPVIGNYEYLKKQKQLSHEKILNQYLLEKGKHMKPVSPNKPRRIDYKGDCPTCGASCDYLYENNIERQQMLCKVCRSTFTVHNARLEELIVTCPYCSRRLEPIKERNGFTVFKCRHDSCSFYQQNLEKKKSLGDAADASFKLRYIYRAFDLELPQLDREVRKELGSKVDLANIRVPKHTLGLILTYYVNYGLSSRKTAAVMKDIHQVKISHQSVVNYAQAAAVVVKSYLETYPYELTEDLTGDETYVKVKGKNHYIFFISDRVKRIITSYQVFEKRDTLAAIVSLYQTFLKYKEKPKKLKLVTDGNPIYNLAHLYFSLKDIPFQLIQVIGLQNKSETDKLFRPFKQVTERLNRTFKQESYLTMNGFGSLDTANGYLVLFSACFNFLRPHSSLKYRVPVEVPEIQSCPHMPAKWVKLLELSYGELLA